MKNICFSNPTVMLKRPIAEIISHLKNKKITLLSPKNLITGFIDIHFEKVLNAKSYFYLTLNPPIISSEWPIPVNPFFLINLIKILKENDIIHLWVPFYISNTVLILIKRLFFPKKKLFITMDTFPGLSFKMNNVMDIFFKIYYRTIGKYIFSSATKIIVYGDSLKKYAFQVGIPKKKIEVIPTGVNIKVKEKDSDIKKEFNLKESSKIVLFIGLLNERKGVDIFIETAEILPNQDVKFIIVGEGSKEKYYKKLVREKKLSKKVIFTGFRRDVHNFYHSADIFFFPSRGEGLAGVIMESMIYGVPIVTSDIAGTRDLIKNEENGFICQTEDLNGYQKKIEILLKNDKIRQKFIYNSKERIRQQFDWIKNIKLLENLYQKS